MTVTAAAAAVAFQVPNGLYECKAKQKDDDQENAYIYRLHRNRSFLFLSVV